MRRMIFLDDNIYKGLRVELLTEIPESEPRKILINDTALAPVSYFYLLRRRMWQLVTASVFS